MMIDLVCLKKRAEFLECADNSFDDEKVFDILAKVCPPSIGLSCTGLACNEFECVVPNKFFRNYIDLIPESDRNFVTFIYEDGNNLANLEEYLKLAMTAPAFSKFQSLISAGASESDLYLMKYIIWHSVVLKRPVGFDFGNYEMNQIFSNLPIDISKDKISFGRNLEFHEFYRMIKFAEWGIANAN